MEKAKSRKRFSHGVLATLEVSEEDIVLVFNDTQEGVGATTDEAVVSFFTERAYPRTMLMDAALTKADFEDIGLNLVARLAALNRLTPKVALPRQRKKRRTRHV